MNDRINWRTAIVVVGFHLAVAIGAAFAQLSWWLVGLCVASYFLRTTVFIAAYHRYFAHRTFRTSRWFQFVLAWLGATAIQPGALSWAADHRHHHARSDRDDDIHSPVARGFWWAHLGWMFTDTAFRQHRIKDFAKFPELRWLNRHVYLPMVAFAAVLLLAGGWNALYWGLLVSTLMIWHAIWSINSVTHLWGRRRFETSDQSRNSALLVIPLLGMGENWHNNHHHYPSCARQGFYWWEVDMPYYAIRVLGWFRVVWDIREPPPRVFAVAQTPS